MKNRNLDHSDNWATPPDLYFDLDLEFGFDFDPCPLHADFDGLDPAVQWGKMNFINPPYSLKLKAAFVQRAVIEKLKGRGSVLLLPVSTSTKLFHQYIKPVANEIRFLEGRV